MTDFAAGAKVLDYGVRIGKILEILAETSQEAHTASALLAGDEGFYDGAARQELKLFYDSYAAHVDKLIFLQSAAVQFLGKVVDEVVKTDGDLLTLLLARMDGGR